MQRVEIVLAMLGGATGCDIVFGLDDRVPPPVDAPSTYVETVLEDSPLAYWRFSADSTIATRDLVGTDVVGLYRGNASPSSAGALAGDPDRAVTLDGAGDFVDMGDRLPFEGIAPFSIEAWINPSTKLDYDGLIAKVDETLGGARREGWMLYSHPLAIGFERSANRIVQDVRTGPLVDNRWSHVVATYDGITLRLYVDGMLKASEATTLVQLPVTTRPLVIGGRNGGEYYFFNGAVDEVAIYDHALDPARAERHWRVGVGL